MVETDEKRVRAAILRADHWKKLVLLINHVSELGIVTPPLSPSVRRMTLRKTFGPRATARKTP